MQKKNIKTFTKKKATTTTATKNDQEELDLSKAVKPT
jgi:hypothetical protein